MIEAYRRKKKIIKQDEQQKREKPKTEQFVAVLDKTFKLFQNSRTGEWWPAALTGGKSFFFYTYMPFHSITMYFLSESNQQEGKEEEKKYDLINLQHLFCRCHKQTGR